MERLCVKKDSLPGYAGETEEHLEVAQALSAFLASTYVLYQKSLFYHWNIIGWHFVSLHKMFENHYEELQKAGDEIAERIRALGYFTPSTLREFLSMSSIQEDQTLPKSDYTMVENLLKSHETCSIEAHNVLSVAKKVEDEATMDLMIKRIAFHDKTAWMLRSLLS